MSTGLQKNMDTKNTVNVVFTKFTVFLIHPPSFPGAGPQAILQQ